MRQIPRAPFGILIAAAAVAACAGCEEEQKLDTSNTSMTVYGTYMGTVSGTRDGASFSEEVTVTIPQASYETSQFEGTWETEAGGIATATGLVTESSLSLSLEEAPPCSGSYAGTGQVTDRGHRLTGTLSGKNCTGEISATFDVIRQLW